MLGGRRRGAEESGDVVNGEVAGRWRGPGHNRCQAHLHTPPPPPPGTRFRSHDLIPVFSSARLKSRPLVLQVGLLYRVYRSACNEDLLKEHNGWET